MLAASIPYSPKPPSTEATVALSSTNDSGHLSQIPALPQPALLKHTQLKEIDRKR